MNILCIGGWLTGNSAILDFLDQSKDVSYLKSDFDLIRQDNGILDLIEEENDLKKYKISRSIFWQSANDLYLAIKFKVALYTKHIFRGAQYRRKKIYFSRYDSYIFFNLNLMAHVILFEISRKIIKNFNEIDFWSLWCIRSSYKFGRKKTKFSLYCNPIYAIDCISTRDKIWRNLFSPFKVICVYRNPWDQLYDILRIEAHLQTKPKRFFGNTDSYTPAERILEVISSLHKLRLQLSRELSCDDLLIISFDDFINYHDSVVSKINSFLGLDVNSFTKNGFFNLNNSAGNIGIGIHNKNVTEFIKSYPEIFDQMNQMYLETRCLKQANFTKEGLQKSAP
jgi:hypothetical protein